MNRSSGSDGGSRPRLRGFVQLEVTSRCNLSCPACPRGVEAVRLAERDMPAEVFDGAVEATLADGQRYHLQGWGEPLLRADLPELARSISDRGGLPSLTTNGTVMTNGLAERLVESGLEFLTISVAGGCPRDQETNRPGARLETVLETIRTLRRARKRSGRRKPVLVASYEMTRTSIGSFPKGVGRLKQAGAERLIGVHPILTLSPGQESNRIVRGTGPPDPEVVRSLRRAAVRAMWRSLPFEFEPIVPAPAPACRENPTDSLFVGASGEVSPCVYLGLPVEAGYRARHLGQEVSRRPVSMGNITRRPLAEIWRSPEYERFRRAWNTAGAAPPAPCRNCLRSLGY